MPSDDPSQAVAHPTHNGKRTPRPIHKLLLPVPKLKPPIDPALLKHEQERAEAAQNRIADRITAFSGSMLFVYIHIIWFGCWIGFGVEAYPFGLLTMIVSLEAIFLSTFVMISQNRADAKRQVIADEQWKTVQEEDKQNEELLEAVEADPRSDKGGSTATPRGEPRARTAAVPRVGGNDACAPGGGGLVQDDLEGRRDRHADDRPDQPEERSERQDAREHGEAGDLGSLPDDRRLQDVVLDQLVDDDHDQEDDQGLEADRERDDPDEDAGQRALRCSERGRGSQRSPPARAGTEARGSPR